MARYQPPTSPSQEEIERCKYVGTQIKETMDLLGISVKDAAAVLHPVMEIAFSTAKSYLTDVRKGEIILGYDRHKSQRNKLNWLSILMYSLGVNEEDELVAKTRKLYPHFQFPPSEDRQFVLDAKPLPKNPYEELSLTEKIDHLKPRDSAFLERTVDSLLASYKSK